MSLKIPRMSPEERARRDKEIGASVKADLAAGRMRVMTKAEMNDHYGPDAAEVIEAEWAEDILLPKRGRPGKGTTRVAVKERTIKMPVAFWERLDKAAKAMGESPHFAMRAALVTWVIGRERTGAGAGALVPDSMAPTLRAAREEAGITQTELAARLGTSPDLVDRAEKGTANVPRRYLQALLRACGLPRDWQPRAVPGLAKAKAEVVLGEPTVVAQPAARKSVIEAASAAPGKVAVFKEGTKFYVMQGSQRIEVKRSDLKGVAAKRGLALPKAQGRARVAAASGKEHKRS